MESIVESIEQPKQDDLSQLVSLVEQAHQSLAQHWLGDDCVIELLLASIIARGHVRSWMCPVLARPRWPRA